MTAYYGPSSTDALLFVISEVLEDWDDDPAFAEPAKKLKEVERELDVITASPGHRAALRSTPSSASGQENLKEA